MAFSEKTVMAMICHKPFLIAGTKGLHGKLKGMGFENYTEIFDYSFDDESDLEKRFQLMLDNFVRLQNDYKLSDLAELYDKLKPKLIHNFNLVKKITFGTDDILEIARYFYEIYKTQNINHNSWINHILDDINHNAKYLDA